MIERIGKYELRAELGRGGMGRVYRAYDPSVDRDVAIKVLTNEGDPDLLSRFHSEAGTTAKLNHKNIVIVHTCGQQDDMPYIVMELLDGVDLARAIRERRPLTLLEKVRIMYQVADGLSYAHENHVIHRDVKPANIMLLADGTVKIMDFGIARSRNSTRRTQKGFLLGTISYMAPEQFQLGFDADQLTDLFAYGDVFYELVTGVHPFYAEDPGNVIYKITAADPKPVRELLPECPEQLASIIHQLLAKDRELRYPSLKDTLLDLQLVMFELGQKRAAQILTEVEPLIRENRLDTALIKVKDALELDPMSREAQQLRRKLQDDISRQAVRAKVVSLLETGDAMVSQRRFGEAIQVYENALRLDKSDTAKLRLEQARSRHEKTQHASRLLAEARRLAQQRQLAPALSSANAARRLDPENTEAGPFAERLSAEIARQERERRIQEALQASEHHVGEGNFEQALEALDAVIAEQGASDVVADARQKIVRLQTEAERRKRQKRLEETARAVRSAIKSGNVGGARSGIALLYSDFADVPEAARLAEQFSSELARHELEAETAALKEEVGELARQNRFVEARARVDVALARHPKDSGIQLVSDTLAKVQAKRERADAIARVSEGIVRLRRQGQLDEALRDARNALDQYSDHKPFGDMAAEIEKELREQQRRSTIADAIERGTALVETDPVRAIELLRKTIAETAPEPELQRLLAIAEDAAERRNEHEFVDGVLARSESLRALGEWRKALEEVERGLAKFPNRIQLKAAQSEIRAELNRIARAKKVQDAAQAIEEAIQAGELRKAEALVGVSAKEFAGDLRLKELEAELARAQREAALAALESAVRERFSCDDLQGAGRQIADAMSQFSSEKRWQSLNQELGRRRTYITALERAEGLTREGRFDEAAQVLSPALKIPLPDARAEQMLRTIGEKRDVAEAEARERERKEKDARERERLERVRLEAEARERARLEQERLAVEARERERQEAEARERARLEQERLAAEARERERLERERVEAEARERARLERERVAAETRERERLERERLAAEVRERARQERERVAAETRERERLAAEAREQERAIAVKEADQDVRYVAAAAVGGAQNLIGVNPVALRVETAQPRERHRADAAPHAVAQTGSAIVENGHGIAPPTWDGAVVLDDLKQVEPPKTDEPGRPDHRRIYAIGAIAAAVILFAVALVRWSGQTKAPQLDIDTTKLTATVRPDDTAPVERHIRIRNTPTGGLVVSTAAPWLQLDPQSLVHDGTLKISIDVKQLQTGDNASSVELRTLSGAMVRTIPISVAVVAPPAPVPSAGQEKAPRLLISERHISFQQEGRGAPRPLQVHVATDGQSVHFQSTVKQGAEWMTLSRSIGATPGDLLVSVHPDKLKPGTQSGLIEVFAAGARNQRETISVSLTAGPAETDLSKQPAPTGTPASVATPAGGSTAGPAPGGSTETITAPIRKQWGLAEGRITVAYLGPNETCELTTERVRCASGRPLPGVPVDIVTNPPDIQRVEAPTAANQFGRLVLKNQHTSAITNITIIWTVKTETQNR